MLSNVNIFMTAMNFTDALNQRHCDNMPVFFTGLAESPNNKPKVPLLCILCKSILTKNTKNGDNSVKDSQDNNGCENCTKNFNNLKEALALLSKIPCALTSPLEELPPQPTRNVNFQESKRKSLLPAPDQPSTSTAYNSHMDKSLEFDEMKAENSSTSGNLSDFKRKSPFHQNNPKRPRTSHSPSFRQPHKQSSSENIYDGLSHSIWQLFMENKQTQSVYKNKMALRDKLHAILLTDIPNCGLYVVGSSMTGLGGNSSDMDMCLMLTDNEIDQEREAKNILHRVHSLFLNCSFLSDVQVIYAKVPILKFTERVSGIEVDLNVNNAVGIRNTQLLSSYARIDDRLPPLVLLVKMWARFNGINDAKNNTLSSYSLVLMVIHYLQHACQPPVLPSLQKLQPDKYQPNSDVRKLKLCEDLPSFVSENKKNLGELFVGFLDYFANEFDYFRSVMSVRLGDILPKEVAMNNNSPKNKKGHWKWVCIEEPFDLTNTACAVFKPGVFRYVRQVFVDSWKRLRRTADLGSIME